MSDHLINALACHDLSLSFGARPVLRSVSLSVAAGEMVALVGPNGAGKTTLLRALCGLLAADSGGVTVEGRSLDRLGRRSLARRLAYLPQNAASHWPLSVEAVVGLGRLPHRSAMAAPSVADRAAVARAMATADVVHLAARPVNELSGGERARVMLARALAGTPAVLLADEPVSGLDPYHRLDTMESLKRLSREGAAVVVVLHDLTLAGRYADRLVLLDGGQVAADGAPDQVLTAERLAGVYRIAAVTGRHENESYVLPWRRLGGGDR
ncbi:MAG: ABC transporter ATP-binding protein [Alphaproteobacteria bacterium]